MKEDQEKHKSKERLASYKVKTAIFTVVSFLLGIIFGGLLFYFTSSESPKLPQSQIVNEDKPGYTYAYDGKTKNPSWVLEFLMRGEAVSKQKNMEFYEDSSIPAVIRSKLSDYQNSGFVIAHLLTVSEEGILNTQFPLSTASPQVAQFNQGYWEKVNDYVRDFIKKLWADRVTVATGPLFLPQEEKDGKKYVTYQVIGEDNVAVPTHFFKAIFYPIQNSQQNQVTIGSEIYIIPNAEIKKDAPLESFKASLEKLEELSGIIFPEDMMPYITRNVPPPKL